MGKRDDSSFIKGTIFGALIGGVAALLFAPKSGKETQEDIKRTARKVIADTDQKLKAMSDQLTERLDELKAAAVDLKGEAKEESKGLIKRAEVLKRDLQLSASNLAQSSAQTKDDALADVKRLMTEGSLVMNELERVTRHMVNSTKTKLKRNGDSGAGSEE